MAEGAGRGPPRPARLRPPAARRPGLRVGASWNGNRKVVLRPPRAAPLPRGARGKVGRGAGGPTWAAPGTAGPRRRGTRPGRRLGKLAAPPRRAPSGAGCQRGRRPRGPGTRPSGLRFRAHWPAERSRGSRSGSSCASPSPAPAPR
nr:uncharacterized protein LOC111774031 [Equus caballus]